MLNPLSLQLEACPYLNLPLRINDVRPVSKVLLHNASEQDFLGIEVSLKSNPLGVLEHVWRQIDLAAGQSLELPVKDISLDYDFFLQLTEAITGFLTLTATNAEGRALASISTDSRLLPSNHWGGNAGVPELLAAHVLPNDPAVASILRRASELLQASQLSLNAYQSKDPQTAGAQVIAVLAAIREQQIHYVVAPRSFESTGQKIRTPTEIINDGLGNCLDLSCFAAAALEQAGLHSSIILLEEHAFLSVWLHASPVHSGTLQDLQLLRKAQATGLLLACETTLLTNSQASLQDSLEQGKKALNDERKFLTAVDIYAARTAERIRPLNTVKAQDSTSPTSTLDEMELDLMAISQSAIHAPRAPDAAKPPPLQGAARVDEWKKQLLDLTRRNRLLNWRSLRSNLLLPYLDPAKLEDALASGVKFRFDTVDANRGKNTTLKRDLAADHYAPAIREAMAAGLLLLDTTPADLLKTLIQLERNTRLALEEGGASTLYLALGFAVKTAGGEAAPEYRAPLVLVPVDLKRRRAGNTFTLASRDEEAVLNPTLQEFLRREHGIVFEGLTEELPVDENGLDIQQVLAKARLSLLNLPGWEVREDIALGEFSFAKYLMWRDLDRFEGHLRENPVVAHLIDKPREPYYVPGSTAEVYPDRSQLDITFPVSEMLTPLSADASQLAAVRAASMGIDFVLEGPPGTGKSQTITNLIAQCLGEGKSVLFVSEKTAALEVVERRLNAIGLGEFCLELHSNKATKTHVYEQLKPAWATQATPQADWQLEANRLAEIRVELNQQVEALHHEHSNQMNIWEAMSLAIKPSAEKAPSPPATWALEQSASQLEACAALARQLSVMLSDVPLASQDALRPLRGPFEPNTLTTAAQHVVAVSSGLNERHEAFARALGFEAKDKSLVALQESAQLASLLLKARGHDFTRLAAAIDSGTQRRMLLEEADLLTQYLDAVARLNHRYKPEILSLPLKQLYEKWQASKQKFVLFRLFDQWQLKREISPFFTSSTAIDPEADLKTLAELAQLSLSLQGLESKAPGWQETQQAFAKTYIRYLREWVGFAEKASLLGFSSAEAQRALVALADDGTAARPMLAAAEALLTRLGSTIEASTELASAMGLTDSAEGASWLRAPQYVLTLIKLAQRLLQHQAAWRAWGLFAEVKRQAEPLGLNYLAEALIGQKQTQSPAGDLLFRLGYAKVWATAMIASQPSLAGFSGSLQEDRITRFKELDARLAEISKAEIRHRLQSRRDKVFHLDMRPHLAVWNNEKDKKRRQMPVRQLIEGIGPLLTELTPCLLMSPLSVAQYLPADRAIRFDVVVFDEASQIPVWDAIGAIARGKQVIVVGDSKQLPPTSFFEKSDQQFSDSDASATEDFTRVEDMESILDEMQAASLQSQRLRWHYRSRAESLIAFSNRTYYEGELNTFPAPLAEDKAVSYHKIDSSDYVSGSNKAEAQALVSYLIARLRDEAATGHSFGVVTFGMAQRVLIEDMLEQARTQYPELDRHFDPDSDERVFVKNIENVQGDERDVILFSITYGPDQTGRLRMMFGPMNSIGGERRLNVAVTRARQEMHIFTSMEPEQIDLSRLGANAEGARDLRRFLEYARRGDYSSRREPVLSAVERGKARDTSVDESQGALEEALASALREAGYQLDLHVGVSEYKVDIGIRDLEQAGRYLIGIELDGPGYHASATARDRDILRQAVLRGLGWHLVRVWSLDWWHEPARTLEKLLAAIERTKKEGSPPVTASPVIEPSQGLQTNVPVAPAAEQVAAPTAPPLSYQPMKAQDFSAALAGLSVDPSLAFYEKSGQKALATVTRLTLEREAPLLLEEAIKRISSTAFGIGRATSRVQAQLLPVLQKVGYVVEVHGERLVYLDEAQAAQPHVFRPPSQHGDYSRGIPDIPLLELASLARDLIPLGLDGDTLIREMGARIGVSSVRGSSRDRIERAIEMGWKG